MDEKVESSFEKAACDKQKQEWRRRDRNSLVKLHNRMEVDNTAYTNTMESNSNSKYT